MSRKTFILSGVVVALLIAAGYGVYVYTYNKPHRSVQKADLTIEALQLLAEFEQDEAKANTMYLDKVIEVNGVVKDVMKRDNSFTLLLGDPAALGSVSCALDSMSATDAYGVKAGDTVIVRGICTGMLMDVALTNCQLIK